MIKKTFSKECQEELQEKIKVIYPWSLKNHNIISLNYDGLIQDLTIYWNEEAQHREGFTYSDTEVTIPNFFTVLNGVYQDSYKQKKLESSLKNSRNTLYFDTVKAFELTIGMDLESLDENSES